MASLWKKLKAWSFRRKYAILITLGIIVAVVAIANTWQETYLTLPEPEVRLPVVEGAPPPPAVAAGLDKFDILLLGLDRREDEPAEGSRTDTILLITIDPEDYYACVLSIPRDTRVRFRDRWRKINEVFSYEGAEGSVRAVEDLLEVAIDRYAVVDFQGAIDLVDLMGGVTVDVPIDMYKPLENIDLKKGPAQHLNGYDALAYVRYRDERLSDMDRSERQKEVLLQLADMILSPANILKLPTVARTALTYMETNISLQEILTLAKYGRTILNQGVENRVLPGINDYFLGGWYYVPFLEELGLPIGEAEVEYREYLRQAQEAKAAEERQKKEAEEAALLEEGGDEDEDGEEPPQEGGEWAEGTEAGGEQGEGAEAAEPPPEADVEAQGEAPEPEDEADEGE
ncbi:MAG: LCP family protein [Clostridiales bacterium]|nr:LCP family protein [Clostridiales bacterium]